MANYSGKRLLHERNIERQYFANTLRVNLIANVQQHEGKYPWESEDWIEAYPYLGRFLNEVDSEYGESEDDYFNILSDFQKLSQNEKWVLQSLHESLDRGLKKYAFSKPKSIKSYLPVFVSLLTGVLLGWLFL